MRVAIPKLYLPIDPQYNMEEYLKNTEKVAVHTLSMLDREQKINYYLKMCTNPLGVDTLAFYPRDNYTTGHMEKVIHTFHIIMDSFKPFCNFGPNRNLDLGVLA